MITFQVSPDGKNPFLVTAVARDVLLWERTGKGRTMGSMFDNVKLSDCYDLAYLAAKRLGLYDGNAAEFEKTCDVMPHAEVDEEADPFPTAQ